MIGAIIGDVVGSRFEWHSINSSVILSERSESKNLSSPPRLSS